MPTLQEIVEGTKTAGRIAQAALNLGFLAGGFGYQVLKEGLNRNFNGLNYLVHIEGLDYSTALTEGNSAIAPVCHYTNTNCPYGTGNKHTAESTLFFRHKDTTKRIPPGETVVYCRLGEK